jgi:hypothetical protein
MYRKHYGAVQVPGRHAVLPMRVPMRSLAVNFPQG